MWKKVVPLVVLSFLGLVILIVYITINDYVTLAVGRLMVVALIGLYVGFGTLIGTYVLIAKLDKD